MVNLKSLVLVEKELLRLGIRPIEIGMGEALVDRAVTPDQQMQLRLALRQSGLVLLEDKQEILVHQISRLIMEVIYNFDEPLIQNMSSFLSARLGYDYTYISNVFSEATDTTIERFYICHKIERVKQLLLYENLSIAQIAQKMHYCSPAHLSSQFKKITGLAPSQFKRDNHGIRPLKISCA